MNLTERLLQALARRGATEVFGIPGDFALPLFREIERSALLPLLFAAPTAPSAPPRR